VIGRSVLVVVCVALIAVVCGSCAVESERHARAAQDESVPFGLLEPDAPRLVPPSSALAAESAAICFVREDVLTIVPIPLTPPIKPANLLAALAEPPSDSNAKLRTAIGDPPIVRSARVAAGIARVDLLPAVSDLGSDEQLLAIAQLVCTLTGRPGVGQVSFTLDGAPVDVPRGDGSLTDRPVSRDVYRELLP
jgi:spore germination protein GerM